jgi:hypothetical protein
MEANRRRHRRREPAIVTVQPGLAFSATCLQIGDTHYRYRAMGRVHVQQSGHDPLTRRAGWLATFGALLLGFIAPRLHLAGVLAGLALVFMLVTLTVVSARRRPRLLELWVEYEDQPARIFVSGDRWVFHAVERHLHRILVEIRIEQLGSPRLVPRSAPGHYETADRDSAGRDRHEHLLDRAVPTVVNVPHPSTMHPSTMRPDGSSGWERAA